MTDGKNFLENHLNVWWLRPESALWDASASTAISQYKIKPPSIDLGCGNGIFSFITAGGSFSIDYDWHVNVDTSSKKKDIYDYVIGINISRYIKKKPKYKFDWGLDIKDALLKQAKGLGFYRNLKKHDLNKPLPFESRTLNTVFSNTLYWLDDPAAALEDICRVLRPKGTALICVPSDKFYTYCSSYRWQKEKNTLKKDLMKAVNLDRDKCIHLTFSKTLFTRMAEEAGFSKIEAISYLSPLTLKIWDIGLRPFSRPLIKMANSLSLSRRREIKKEFMDTCMKYLIPLYDLELRSKVTGGFFLFALKK